MTYVVRRLALALWILLFMATSYQRAAAQSLHFLRYINDRDPSIHAQGDAERMAQLGMAFGTALRSRMTVRSAEHFASDEHFRRAELVEELEDLARRTAGADDTLVLYLSGHGDRQSFAFQDGSMTVSEILAGVRQIPARLRIVIFDACRNNAPDRRALRISPQVRTRGTPSLDVDYVRAFLADLEGDLVLYATSDGQAANSLDSGGLFTVALAEAFEDMHGSDQPVTRLQTQVNNRLQYYMAASPDAYPQTPEVTNGVRPVLPQVVAPAELWCYRCVRHQWLARPVVDSTPRVGRHDSAAQFSIDVSGDNIYLRVGDDNGRRFLSVSQAGVEWSTTPTAWVPTWTSSGHLVTLRAVPAADDDAAGYLAVDAATRQLVLQSDPHGALWRPHPTR